MRRRPQVSTCVALTDHDTAEGWDEAAARPPRRPASRWSAGMEISTRHDGHGVHLLAYLPDPHAPAPGRGARPDPRGPQLPAPGDARAAARARHRHRPPRTCAAWRATRSRPGGRTSPTRWSTLGVVGDRDRGVPALPEPRPAGVRQPVRRAAGDDAAASSTRPAGVSVIAHPWGRHGREEPGEATLAALAEAGLSGIEVDHQDHDAADPRPAPGDRPEPRPRRHRLQRPPRHRQGRPRARLQHHGARASSHRLLDAGACGRRPLRPAGPRGGRPVSALVNGVLLTEVFVTLFVIMDPVGTVPIFLSLTAGRSAQHRPQGRLAGGRGVVPGDRDLRVLRPADPGATSTSRCPRSSARAACCSCWSRWSC